MIDFIVYWKLATMYLIYNYISKLNKPNIDLINSVKSQIGDLLRNWCLPSLKGLCRLLYRRKSMPTITEHKTRLVTRYTWLCTTGAGIRLQPWLGISWYELDSSVAQVCMRHSIGKSVSYHDSSVPHRK